MILMDENYLDELNEQQRAAVEYCDGPQLVIAGAGSGKTRVLTYKIVHLLRLGYEPWRILALTFTNKAAKEMRERVEQLVGGAVASKLWMGTFHSIFARILRANAELIGFKSNFTIYDSADSKSLVKTIIKDMQLDDKIYKPSAVLSAISGAKNALVSPEDYALSRDVMEAPNSMRFTEPIATDAWWPELWILTICSIIPMYCCATIRMCSATIGSFSAMCLSTSIRTRISRNT